MRIILPGCTLVTIGRAKSKHDRLNTLEFYTDTLLFFKEKTKPEPTQPSMRCNSYITITSFLVMFGSGYVESLDSQKCIC